MVGILFLKFDLRGIGPLLGGTRGMGRQMVEAFLLQGANVSYSARNITHTEFNDFLETLPPTNKATAIGTALDVSSKTDLDRWVQASVQRFGGLDTVIANGRHNQLPWRS